MKYTTKITQPQYAGKVKIEPKGGDLTDKQVEEIKADPWGQELIKIGLLVIEGGKAPDKPSPETEKKEGQGSK
ncbi:MAG: hypothetical protein LBF74_01050 [Treponema sp.]|jgi:hypothetical protein|nr:hypothetical protein [Treponema sp.]